MSNALENQQRLVSVKTHGAVGDGVTDDTAAIQAAIATVKAAGGGTVHFPRGSYKVVFPSGLTAYTSLFALPSHTSVEFEAGATMTASAVTGSTLFAAVFGVDQTALPVTNLRFSDVRIAQTAPGGGQELAAGIMLQVAPNTAANSITNVRIERCHFEGTASAIYILQRTSAGTTTRQVGGVKIRNCTGMGNYSGITADGEDIEITGNTLVGSTTTPASYYDGVSIHSGRNVRVVGNHISYYGEFGVNVRNSPNNLSGSTNVVIAHNTVAECTLKGIGVSTASGENVYGVTNVSITGNTVTHATVSNSCTGILLSAGTATAGTPFNKIAVTGNLLENCNSGLEVTGTAGVPLLYLTLSGNNVFGRTTCAEAQLKVNHAQLSSITGNVVNGENVGGAYKSVAIENLQYSTVSGNQFYSGSAFDDTLYFATWTDVAFNGNHCFGKYVFATIGSTCVIGGNRFTSAGVCALRPLTGTWSLAQARIEAFGGTPGSGTWAVGDRVYGTAAAGGNIGVVCTTAGTPGTWKTFGAIAA
jgi:hypothetical protein